MTQDHPDPFSAWLAAYLGHLSARPSLSDLRNAFLAGAEYAATAMSEAKRAGSSLRGRVIVQYATLCPEAVRNENPQLDPETTWPCLHLDDNTLAYPATRLEDGQWVPASLIGVLPDGRKANFEVRDVTKLAGLKVRRDPE